MRFSLLIILMVLCFTLLPSWTRDLKETRIIPLENRSCEEIYELGVAGDLHPTNKSGQYAPEAVMLYYLENCYEGVR
jgi:hypothetical protein